MIPDDLGECTKCLAERKTIALQQFIHSITGRINAVTKIRSVCCHTILSHPVSRKRSNKQCSYFGNVDDFLIELYPISPMVLEQHVLFHVLSEATSSGRIH